MKYFAFGFLTGYALIRHGACAWLCRAALGCLLLTATAQAQQITVVNAANYQSGVTPDSIAALFTPAQLTSAIVVAGSQPLPDRLLGVTVQIDGQFCSLFAIAPHQVNFHIPATVTPGQHRLIIAGGFGTKTGQFSIAVLFYVQQFAPAVFTRNQTGHGEAAADFEQRGDKLIVSLYGLGFGKSAAVRLVTKDGEFRAVYCGPNHFTGQTQINLILNASELSAGESKPARLRVCVDEGQPAAKCWESQAFVLKRDK